MSVLAGCAARSCFSACALLHAWSHCLNMVSLLDVVSLPVGRPQEALVA